MAQHLRSLSRPLRLSVGPSLNAVSGVRRFAAGPGHGPAKVNFWEDLTNPGQWKEEQFVLISLSGWGLLFYSGYRAVAGGKKPEAKVEAAAPVEPAKH